MLVTRMAEGFLGRDVWSSGGHLGKKSKTIMIHDTHGQEGVCIVWSFGLLLLEIVLFFFWWK